MSEPSERPRDDAGASPRSSRRSSRQQLKRELRELLRQYDAVVRREIKAQKRAGLTAYEWTLSPEALAVWAQAERVGRQLGGIYDLTPGDADADVDARGRDRGVTS